MNFARIVLFIILYLAIEFLHHLVPFINWTLVMVILMTMALAEEYEK